MKTILINTFLCLFFILQLQAQELIPRLDYNPHEEGVVVMKLSPDKKYQVIGDKFGNISYRHVETGKYINSFNLGTQIFDIAFAKEDHTIHVINKKCDKVDLTFEQLFVEKLSFIGRNTYLKTGSLKRTIIKEGSLSNLNSATLDLSPDKEKLILKCAYVEFEGQLVSEDDPGEVYSYFYHLDSNYETLKPFNKLKGNKSGGFLSTDSYQILPAITDDENSVLHQIDMSSLELERSPIDFSCNLLNDLNNSYVNELENNIAFVDLNKNIDFKISKEYLVAPSKDSENDFDDSQNSEPELVQINTFSFSDNGDYLAIACGKDKAEWSVLGTTTNEDGIGQIIVYDVKRDRFKYITLMEKNQIKFKVVGLTWLSDEIFAAIDENGEVHHYSVHKEYPIKVYPKTMTTGTAMAISDDLNHIIYSKFMDKTVEYFCDQSHPTEIYKDNFSRHVDVSENGVVVFENAIWENDLNKYIAPFAVRDHTGVKISDDGKRVVFLTQETGNYNYGSDEFTVNDYLYNSDSIRIGFICGDQEIFEFSRKELPETTKFSTSVYYCIYVFDKERSSRPYTILTEIIPEAIQISKNGKYLAYINVAFDKLPESQVFNLEKREWPLMNYDRVPISLVYFDPYSNVACNVYGNEFYEVWDTDTEKIIYKGSNFIPNPTKIRINSHTNEVIFIGKDESMVINYLTGEPNPKLFNNQNLKQFEFSPDGQIFYSAGIKSVYGFVEVSGFANYSNAQPIYNSKSKFIKDNLTRKAESKHLYFHKSKPLVFKYDGYGKLELIDLKRGKLLCTLHFLRDAQWIAYTPDGYFDASEEGRDALYYVTGDEVILYNQIKEEFWITGLLKKLLNNPNILDDKTKRALKLYPQGSLKLLGEEGEIAVKLQEANGGIGAVGLYINNKEVVPDINPNRQKSFNIKLTEEIYDSYLYESGVNKISIVTYNKEGWLNSRPVNLYLKTDSGNKSEANDNDFSKTFVAGDAANNTEEYRPPGLFGLFVGSSKYYNKDLHLKFADDDAKILKDAFDKISDQMYDKTRVNLRVLKSEASTNDSLSNKNNIIDALEYIAVNAKPHDIIVLFFSGHGITIDDDFYLLTREAGNVDLNNNVEEREKVTVSSKELNELLRKVKSTKQLLVVDACHSGQIAKILENNSKSTLTSSQEKALEFLGDKMGVYILASSESNQKSFESANLQQGLLTYSMILGMTKEANPEDFINILDLLNNASKSTEDIGKRILGLSQRPVLGVAKGGSSFPIGTINEDLKIIRPQDKILFTKPKFVMKDIFIDPEGFEDYMESLLKNRGAIGTKEKFTYIAKNIDPEAYTIAGSYDLKDGNINVEWRIFRGSKLISGPFSKEVNIHKKDKLASYIINKTLKLFDPQTLELLVPE